MSSGAPPAHVLETNRILTREEMQERVNWAWNENIVCRTHYWIGHAPPGEAPAGVRWVCKRHRIVMPWLSLLWGLERIPDEPAAEATAAASSSMVSVAPPVTTTSAPKRTPKFKAGPPSKRWKGGD